MMLMLFLLGQPDQFLEGVARLFDGAFKVLRHMIGIIGTRDAGELQHVLLQQVEYSLFEGLVSTVFGVVCLFRANHGRAAMMDLPAHHLGPCKPAAVRGSSFQMVGTRLA